MKIMVHVPALAQYPDVVSGHVKPTLSRAIPHISVTLDRIEIIMADNKEAQFSSLEDLFEADLEDIADLAGFETPPAGSYILKVSTETKEINDKPSVVANFEVVETVELKYPDSEDKKYRPPVKDGTMFSSAYILGNAVAEGRLKQFLAPFGEHFGVKGKGSVGILVRDTIKDVVIAATVTNRADKEDPEIIYAGIKNIQIS